MKAEVASVMRPGETLTELRARIEAEMVSTLGMFRDGRPPLRHRPPYGGRRGAVRIGRDDR